MSCTALVLRERWAVDDPLLDCAIMIIDHMAYQNARLAGDPCWPPDPLMQYPEDPWWRMTFLEDARKYCEKMGKVGHVWTDEGFQIAREIFHNLELAAWLEYKVEEIKVDLERRAKRVQCS